MSGSVTKPSLSIAVLFLPAFLLQACASPDATGTASADTTSIQVALTTVPSGVQCVSVAVTVGTQSVTKQLTLAAGSSSATLSLGQLPAGTATIRGTAFNVACASIGTATPTFISDPATADLRPGVLTSVELVFRPNNQVGVSLNFLSNVAEVSVGWFASFARMVDGTLRFWGGDPIVGVQRTAAVVPASLNLNNVSQISVGQNVTCILRADGTVTCWGFVNNGNISIAPTAVSLPTTAVQIAVGRGHACAVLSDGRVACWGANNFSGEQGNGSTVPAPSSAPAIVPLSSQAGVGRLAVGVSTTCIVDSSGTATCWGDNSSGQFGNGSTVSSFVPVAAATSLRAIADLKLGDQHACALRADGGLYCWGDNTFGQLGDGTITSRLSPVAVPGLTQVVQLATGVQHTCAVTQTGALACWGSNGSGQIGDGSGNDAHSPVTLPLSPATAVRANGNLHTCAELKDLSVRCWGFNNAGQLGIGSLANSAIPAAVRLQ